LILGIAVALLLEYLNNTVRTYRDLTSIKGLTYLGTFRLSPAGRPGELAKR
jgi:capsular polysaccharide biosynthesis protein